MQQKLAQYEAGAPASVPTFNTADGDAATHDGSGAPQPTAAPGETKKLSERLGFVGATWANKKISELAIKVEKTEKRIQDIDEQIEKLRTDREEHHTILQNHKPKQEEERAKLADEIANPLGKASGPAANALLLCKSAAQVLNVEKESTPLAQALANAVSILTQIAEEQAKQEKDKPQREEADKKLAERDFDDEARSSCVMASSTEAGVKRDCFDVDNLTDEQVELLAEQLAKRPKKGEASTHSTMATGASGDGGAAIVNSLQQVPAGFIP